VAAQDGRPMTSRRYATLDGLRGVAALAVVMLHIEHPSFRMPVATYTAVDLFFLISGFVIAQAYEGRIARFGVLAFLRARLVRLYPMLLIGLLILPAYLVAVFVRYGLSPATPWQVLGSLGASLLFLPSRLPASSLWDAGMLFPLDGPVWSLMLEMGVNLAYALLLLWLSRRALAFIVLVSGAVLVAAQLHLGGVDLGWGWPNAWGGAPRATFSFFLGVLIFRLKIPRPTLAPWLIVAAVPALFCAPPILAVLVGFPLVLIAATGPDTQGSGGMTVMGALSYPLYVIHLPLLYWIRWLLPLRWPKRSPIPASLALVVACAFGVLKLWDEPVRRWLSRRTA
jgi:peptidoglycan/LPS O-acetylase OafA/YrhL